MKKLIFVLLAIALALVLGACNTSGGDPEESGEAKDTEWTVEFLYTLGSASDYPGAEVDLSGRDLVDISKYASVTVNAILYTDEEGTTEAVTPTGDKKNLAQFKLLKTTTGTWTDENNICGPTKYEMKVNGDTIWTVPATASGVPVVLLLQANWVDFTEDGVKVKSIRVNSIAFTAKTSDVSLDVVYGDNYVSTAGNKITFTNATYSDGAAIFVFPSTFPASFTGKKLVIKFSIPDHTNVPSTPGATDVEHQIHVQAANSDKQKFNGRNDQPGQKYITLDSSSETGWTDDGRSGTIRVPLNDLLAAADVSADANDCKGPFTLDAIRICNNGTTWNESKDGATITHVRCKSYTLVIESVTVE